MSDERQARLAAIRARLEAVKQPWALEWEGQTLYVNDADGDEIVAQTFAIATWEPEYSEQKAECDTASAELIVNAPADLAWLLSELEAATARAGRAESLAQYAQHDPGCYALYSRQGEAAACKCGFYAARDALAGLGA